MLSKSKYTRGMNCHKSLWLYANRREEQKIGQATMALFARGINVGELAQSCFLGGSMAVTEDYPTDAAAGRTQEMIRKGVETIYEATLKTGKCKGFQKRTRYLSEVKVSFVVLRLSFRWMKLM